MYCVVWQSLLDGPDAALLGPLFSVSLPMGSCALVTSMYLTVSIRWDGPLNLQGARKEVTQLPPNKPALL